MGRRPDVSDRWFTSDVCNAQKHSITLSSKNTTCMLWHVVKSHTYKVLKEKFVLILLVMEPVCWQSSHLLLEHPHSVLAWGDHLFFCLYAKKRSFVSLLRPTQPCHPYLFLALSHMKGCCPLCWVDLFFPLFHQIRNVLNEKWEGRSRQSMTLLGPVVRAGLQETYTQVWSTLEGFYIQRQIGMKWNVLERNGIMVSPQVNGWADRSPGWGLLLAVATAITWGAAPCWGFYHEHTSWWFSWPIGFWWLCW